MEKHDIETMEDQRYAVIDAVRGFAIVNMIAFHAVWDLVYLYDVNLQWLNALGGVLWQQMICWMFILVSGFCLPLSRHPLQHGVEVSLAGLAVTMTTLVLEPQALIIFGVLTLLGACMIIGGLAAPLLSRGQRHPLLWLVAAMLLFALLWPIRNGYVGLGSWQMLTIPGGWYANLVTTFFGLPARDFYSADYFPLFPWLFLFIAGYYLYIIAERRHWLPLLVKSHSRFLEWAGRHSLLIYLLHQPVIYVLLRPFFPS